MIGCYFQKQSIQHTFVHYVEYTLLFGLTFGFSIWVLARMTKLKLGIDQTKIEQCAGTEQTEQTKMWVFTRPTGAERNLGIKQIQKTKNQTEGATKNLPMPVLGCGPYPGKIAHISDVDSIFVPGICKNMTFAITLKRGPLE